MLLNDKFLFLFLCPLSWFYISFVPNSEGVEPVAFADQCDLRVEGGLPAEHGLCYELQ
jgi:hypothetical protein